MANQRKGMHYFRFWVRLLILICIMVMPLYMLISYAMKGPFIIKVIPDMILMPRAFHEIRDEIMHYMHQNMKKIVTADQLLAFVRQKYPCIGRIQIRRKSSDLQTITLHARKPIVFINNMYVITSNGDKVLADYYIPEVYQNLFSIRLPMQLDDQIVKDVYKVVMKIPLWITNHYTCEWVDKTLFLLRDTVVQCFTVKANGSTEFTDYLRMALGSVQRYCLAKNSESKKRRDHAQWIIDTRFKNQLVLSRQKGEH